MLNRSQYLVLVALGALAIVLTIANSFLAGGVRSQQREVAQRAVFIQQTAQQLEPVYQGMVRGIAEAAVREKDADLRRVLEAQGINVNVQQNAQQAPKESKP
jgi:hypothetical protein